MVVTHVLDLLLTSLECSPKIMYISLSISLFSSAPSHPINVSFLKQFMWRSVSVSILRTAVINLELYQGFIQHIPKYLLWIRFHCHIHQYNGRRFSLLQFVRFWLVSVALLSTSTYSSAHVVLSLSVCSSYNCLTLVLFSCQTFWVFQHFPLLFEPKAFFALFCWSAFWILVHENNVVLDSFSVNK